MAPATAAGFSHVYGERERAEADGHLGGRRLLFESTIWMPGEPPRGGDPIRLRRP